MDSDILRYSYWQIKIAENKLIVIYTFIHITLLSLSPKFINGGFHYDCTLR